MQGVRFSERILIYLFLIWGTWFKVIGGLALRGAKYQPVTLTYIGISGVLVTWELSARYVNVDVCEMMYSTSETAGEDVDPCAFFGG